MKFKNLASSWWSLVGLFIIGSFVCIPSIGCGKSDAARMEEFRKYAGAGSSKDDEDEEDDYVAPVESTPYTPPARGAAPGSTPAADTATVSADASDPVAATPQAAAKPQPAAPIDGLTDTKSPPATPLSEVERRQITLNNLTRISQAFETYRESKGGGSYPAQYIGDSNGRPLLSWRVSILPLLGYEKLYKQFKLNQPWDSNHNRTLIDKIPSVYQSPERFDTWTNYLGVSGSSAAFNGARPKPIRRWEDGLENALTIVEVNDDKSVIWTQPEDYKVNYDNIREGLGGLRAEGFFAIWGGGELGAVPNAGNLRTAFTVDGGDITPSTLKKPAFAEAGGLANAFKRNTGVPRPGAPAQPGGSPATGPTAGGGGPAMAGGARNAPSFQGGPIGIAAADAQAAFTDGREADAIKLYYANIAASDTADSWLYQYQWVPGLSRPSAIIRYGVGVEFRGPNAAKARVTALKAILASIEAAKAPTINPSTGRPIPNRARGNSQGAAKAFNSVAGNFGAQILQMVKARPLHAPFIIEQPKTTRRQGYISRDDREDMISGQIQPGSKGTILAPGIQFIGVDRERTLIAAARKHEVDVLILLRIDEKPSTRGSLIKDVRVSLVDVVRKKNIYQSKKLNSRAVQQAKLDLVKDDPTLEVLDDLRDFLADKLTPAPIPAALRPAVAAKRVNYLAGQTEKNPLRSLAEIQFYRQMDLIRLQEQMKAYSELIDQEAALTLIGGSPDEKAVVLKPFMPREVPAS